MVLDALASYVGNMLKQVVEEELGMLLGVSGEIDKMDDKLQDLKNFLADADRKKITDKSVQEWVELLKSAMYEATDILDLCQLKAMERGPSTVDAGCFNPLLFCMRNPSHAHDIGTRMKALNQKLDNIKERSTAFNFSNLGSYKDRHSSRVHASHPDNLGRETIGDFDRSGVVGEKIKDDTRALVEKIMKGREEVNRNIMVVAIVGVGGIGKTTLAQNVFNDEAIEGEFSKKIWLSVNQNFSHVELLRRAIIEAGGDAQPHGSVKNALHKTLKETLSGHKTFLVMDDVWDHKAWEDVMKIPLVNAAASGSRVLITTRHEGVARGMRATLPNHHVNILAPDDAWSLLKKQVLSGEVEEDHINSLKDIGMKIIEKCGGLPLAVKVMGGLLHESGTRSQWKKVLADFERSTTKMPPELNDALYLSYEDMPPYMKQCFLYYSLLPKSRIFNMDQVIAMWISEGFIHENSNDLEEAGRTCYNGLVSRNLIEPNKRCIIHRVCSMHDVVRSFAHSLTKDEALVAHNAEVNIRPELNTKKFIRLSIQTNLLQSDELDWKSVKEQRSVRTLISTIEIKMSHTDILLTFSSLRTLHIESADVAALVELLHQLKHLRYLALLHTDISILPVSIGKMKLLQFLYLFGCNNLVNLPDSIVQLGQMRFVALASVSKIPRGFRSLTNMSRLHGFRAYTDGDWCSLDELGPLSQLISLELVQLESVPSAMHAANAKLGEKMHLIDLYLFCTSRLGEDGLVKEKEGVSKEEQQRIEKVFDELHPPPSVEIISIAGYFGQQLPRWMMSMSMVPLKNMKHLLFSDLACCTQLPNGLCRLPYLQVLQVDRAPCIRHVGTGFLQGVATPFPRLKDMILAGMVEWEEWEWEEKVQAMPRLEELKLQNCKLRRVPPGLASNARALKKIFFDGVQQVSYLENLPSVIELIVHRSPNLERVSNLPNLHKLAIANCPKLKVLESIPALQRLVLRDYIMETLPGYMRDITPRHLQLDCRLWLLASVAAGQSGLEWDKFSHVEHVKAYTRDGEWYVLYTRRDNCKLDSNINRSTVFEETLSSCMVEAQGFEYVYKMTRSTFSYICSLVRVPFLEDMMVRDHTFVDGRVLSLQDRVAVALRVLSSGEPPKIIGSSIGVDESTVSLVTQRFVDAMWERAANHLFWPHSAKMGNIKRKFDNIHGLPNCCGVVHTVHFKFGSKDRDHEEKDTVLMLAVIDSDMRFTDCWLSPSGSDSTLHTSMLFKECEKGTWLNGTKLDLSDDSDVGEYIIGDAGYPLRPWLLTPYQLKNDLSDSDSKVQFNRRHSAATAVALRALARLKDTWKFLQGQGWRPNNEHDLCRTIHTCCMLHNTVIDKEEVPMPRYQEVNHKHVRQIPDEDVVRVRDELSQHMIKSGETISSSLVEEQIMKVGRRAFTYICRLVRDHTFVEGRVLSVQDRVAIALRMLTSGETLFTVGTSLCVKESTVLLVTQRFIEAMCERARKHLRWPGSTKMEKIKRKFDKIHGLPNCCGVLNTAHVTFGSQNGHHDDILMQVVVDPDMKFTDYLMVRSASWNQSSILHGSWLFKDCEKGVHLNGSKLKLSDVGEYVIGDAGCPLRPWLLTPYQLESDLSDYEKEFNRRHSAATAVAQRAVARLKDMWKCLQGEGWQPNNQLEMCRTILTCLLLHNIVIDMEEEEEEDEEGEEDDDDDDEDEEGEEEEDEEEEEEVQGAGMPSGQQESCSKPVRQLADEDAVRVRDALSKHLIESGVHTMAAEEHQQEVAAAASGSVDEKEEQEALRRQRADRGKEKVHDC